MFQVREENVDGFTLLAIVGNEVDNEVGREADDRDTSGASTLKADLSKQ